MGQILEWIGYTPLPEGAVLVRLLLAALCGGLLGLERTKKGRAAGIRTYSMVCLGAAVVMTTGLYLYNQSGAGDPARLGAQVVSGIGFIGAGAILVTGRQEIKGLTTAAGLWVTACIGLSVGAGYYLVAVLATAVVLCVMLFGAKFQRRVERNTHRMRLLVFFDGAERMAEFEEYARANHIEVQDSEILTSEASKRAGVIFSVQFPGDMTFERADEILVDAPGVHLIERVS